MTNSVGIYMVDRTSKYSVTSDYPRTYLLFLLARGTPRVPSCIICACNLKVYFYPHYSRVTKINIARSTRAHACTYIHTVQVQLDSTQPPVSLDLFFCHIMHYALLICCQLVDKLMAMIMPNSYRFDWLFNSIDATYRIITCRCGSV